MVRRVNVSSSSRLFWTVLCLALCGMFANAQTADSTPQLGVDRPTFVVAPSFSLSASPTSVAVGDVNGDGKPDMVITQLGSAKVTVFLENGKGGFSAGIQYAAGTRPGNALLADLNGDGKLDLIVTDSATGSVNVLFGNGDGSFGKPTSYPAIANPVGIALGNFKGNGKIDLAIAGPTGVALLLNDGSGHFAAPLVISTARQPLSVTVADLNHDGYDDLVLANQDGTVSALLGDGSGHFQALSALAVASGPLTSIIAGDFNNDGKPDLAVTQGNSNQLTVLLGKGDGTFQPGVAYAVGNGPASVLLADVNNDGSPDLITVNKAANTFSVLLGNGDGTFGTARSFVAGNAPIAAAAGDFNGNGKTDLAILNSLDNTISLPVGRGDGTFIAAAAYRAGLERKSIASGDLNGDGRPDLVVTNLCGDDSTCAGNGTATVFLAKPDGTYSQAGTYQVGVGPIAVALADLRGNKKLDLVALNQKDKTLMVLPGNGDGTFADPQTYSLSANPRALFVGDFNGDGRPDLAIVGDCGQSACSQPGSLAIWLGRADGSLAESNVYTLGYSPASIAGGDLRGTGNLDLVVANACGEDASCKAHGTAMVLSGDGTGKFAAAGEFDIGAAPSAIALGKLGGNGLSLVVAQNTSNQIAVFPGNGKGGFGAAVNYAVGTAPSAVTIANFTGSGAQDVAVTNFQSSTVSLLKGTGTGTLQPAVTFPVGTGPDSMVAVSSGKGAPANLVTANGNTGATPMGADITALPDALLTPTVTLMNNPTSSTVNDAVALTVTVSGSGGTPTGSVTFSQTGTGGTVAITDCGTAGTVTLDGTGAGVCTTSSLLAGTDSLVATYSGDSNYSGADSSNNPVSETVTAATSTTALTSSENPGNVGDSIVFTANVTPFNASVPLSGSVTFKNGVTTLACTGGTSDTGTGVFTCPVSTLTQGSHSITATYSGDSNYNNSTSNTVTEVVNYSATSTALTTSSATSTVNSQVTFTATVTASATGGPNFNGSVTFMDGTNKVLGCTNPAPVNATTGVAKCVTAALAAATHTITAAYGSDTHYSGSSSNLVTQTVNATNTKTTLTASPTTSTVNGSVVLTATVAPNPSATVTVPFSGSVTFNDGTNPVAGCASPVAVNTTTGVATCTTAALAGSTTAHSITAVYAAGDPNYNTSTSTAASVTVNAANTKTTLTASPTTSTVNGSVVLTATVAPNPSATVTVPFSGSVTFKDGANPVAGCASPVAVNTTTGVATCTTASLTASATAHSITAVYGAGDPSYNTSTSGAVSVTVSAANTKTTLTAAPTTSVVNASVTFTATVAPNPSATLTVPFSGSITFMNGTNKVTGCTNPAAVDTTTGVATCTTTSLTASGTAQSITAVYGNDTSYNTSTSNTVSETVNPAATALTLTSNPSTLDDNTPVTFTATLTSPANPITVGFTGTVTFTDTPSKGKASDICGPVTVTTTAGVTTAQCSTTLSGGGQTITAAYNGSNVTNGDPNYQSSTSNALTLSVTVLPSTTVLTAAPSPSDVNQTATFTATVSPAGNKQGLDGTVSFTDTSTTPASTLGCAVQWNPSTGKAICSTAALSLGAHTIVATYAGGNNYTSSSSTPLPQTVQADPTSLTVGSSGTSTVNATVKFTATITPTYAAPPGSTALTGAVDFTDSVTGIAVPNCGAVAPTVGGVATCSTSSLSLGSHTITASFTDGTGNFGASTSTVAQTVNPAPTSVAVTSSANPTIVNEPVTFTATLSFTSGTAALTGTMSFTDNGSPITGCTSLAIGTGVVTCSTATGPWPQAAGSHTIVATYTDSVTPANFATSNGSLPVTVNPASTTVNLASSPNPAVVTSGVTLTAMVTPAPFGSVPLSGSVLFTYNGGPGLSDCAAPVSVTVNPTTGVGTATCITKALPRGSWTITATYSGDSNFTTSKISASQAISDFTIVATPGAVAVTEGFTTATDPFTPQAIAVTPSPISGYSGTLALSCSVAPQAAASGATSPLCTVASPIQVSNATVQQTASVVIDATNSASPGTYIVTVTGSDPNTALVRTTQFAVSVRFASTALSLTSGATTGNSADVSFVLPGGVSLSNLQCPTLSGPTLSSGVAPSALNVGCSINPSSVPSSPTLQVASVTVVVDTGVSPTAQVEHHTDIFAAGLFSIPVFGLLGLLGGRKRVKPALFRLFMVLAFMVAAYQVIGCGGSFTKPAAVPNQTPPGAYDLLIQGTGSDGNTYQAVVQVNVSQ